MAVDWIDSALAALKAHGPIEANVRAPADQLYADIITTEQRTALIEQGLIHAEVMLRLPRCPTCQMHALTVDERCPDCGSGNLDAEPLWHHIRCAGIFTGELNGNAPAACPKCNADLEAESDRVEPAGQIYHCQDCAGRAPEPALHFWCLECDDFHRLDAVAFHRLYRFALTPAGQAILDGASSG